MLLDVSLVIRPVVSLIVRESSILSAFVIPNPRSLCLFGSAGLSVPMSFARFLIRVDWGCVMASQFRVYSASQLERVLSPNHPCFVDFDTEAQAVIVLYPDGGGQCIYADDLCILLSVPSVRVHSHYLVCEVPNDQVQMSAMSDQAYLA